MSTTLLFLLALLLLLPACLPALGYLIQFACNVVGTVLFVSFACLSELAGSW